MAKQQLLNSRYSAAKTTLHRAISNQPREPEAYDLLGMLHEMQGELVKAKNFYKAAVEIAPEYKPAQQNLAQSIM
ncbi:MAG: tetratricopeptide repeat protein [Desulfobacterales bacterium]|nr:tetratricopeptide repeat protein [Desulfobacterales bacterium]